ncbi:MAG: peptidylprolyl isomerase [Ruminococcus flavefaciens]|nr:peptidylprolyl isomerase [Ruminococcus flavefaciens]MCM1228590.1 peptidylprolyl isomerase [Ruminococcus flavefaciens]
MINKKILAFILCGITTASLMTGCGKEVDITTDDSNSASDSSDSSADAPAVPENVDIMNYTAPEKGDTVIEMTFKGYGTVKFRLFSEYADKGVENFVGLANDGFYDGLTFHRIIKDFMIQGGDPLGTGMGGKSLWGSSFDGATDSHLIHLPGAVAYANSGSTASNSSQFYIVTGDEATDDMFAYYEQYGITFSDNSKELYKQYGGTPYLDGNYTVFGQVFDGLDIIYQIQCTATDSNDKPLDDVIIESVKVTEYNGEELKWHISDYTDFDDPVSHDVANFTAPEIGDKIIKMTLKDYGDVKIRLFPEYLSDASENFFTLAEQGYYNGLTFHRVINDFMIQGGDPLGTGTGGECIWGDKFDGGTYFNLVHVAGALAYANSGSTSTNGSQFYIVTGAECTDDYFAMLEAQGASYSDKVKEAYKNAGYGYPYLDGGYTVFGQVIDGLDVVFEVQKTATDDSDKPLEDVIIESMTVEEYDGSEIKWYISDYDTADTEITDEENNSEETAE